MSKNPQTDLPLATHPALAAKGLERYLGSGEGRVHVLKGVNIALERGNTYAIVGPSGCGKSTLLYTLGLLDRQEAGEIFIDGQEISKATDAERTALRNRHLGFVFQFHFLLPEFTALENIVLPMLKHGSKSESDMRKEAERLLAAVGLAEKKNRLATQLSGGEQQRVAIARSLANNPSVLLADEPTGNLDVKNSNVVFDLLYDLAKTNRQAVLIVTHNPEIANRCDRILTMRDGIFIDQ